MSRKEELNGWKWWKRRNGMTKLEALVQNFDPIRMGGSPGELSEELLTEEKRKKGWRMNCDVGEATEGLVNRL